MLSPVWSPSFNSSVRVSLSKASASSRVRVTALFFKGSKACFASLYRTMMCRSRTLSIDSCCASFFARFDAGSPSFVTFSAAFRNPATVAHSAVSPSFFAALATISPQDARGLLKKPAQISVISLDGTADVTGTPARTKKGSCPSPSDICVPRTSGVPSVCSGEVGTLMAPGALSCVAAYPCDPDAGGALPSAWHSTALQGPNTAVKSQSPITRAREAPHLSVIPATKSSLSKSSNVFKSAALTNVAVQLLAGSESKLRRIFPRA
mmetsp:Transcript_44650/g.123752  ORF Transcript_44650/g.123752 Transcript_44650/m.123752 type:complete len:265 (+) Transcript_44650:369-1163(+)